METNDVQMQDDQIRITFGMIVLNGEPFLRYNLRALYSWAHQIIVVEGACSTARNVASSDGRSIDGTLETLQRFQQEEDVEGKLLVVSASDDGYSNGFWPEKTEMCQAFAKRATGNVLWQVDSDEFYREEDIPSILRLLAEGAQYIAFPQYSFWGGIDYTNNSLALAEFDLRGSGVRVFSWGVGSQYTHHRPPTVIDGNGKKILPSDGCDCRKMKRMGIYRYHYSLVFPSQVFSKVNYYSTCSSEKHVQKGGYSREITSWHEMNFKRISNPYRLHNLPGSLSWVRRYRGNHPLQVKNMMADIQEGRLVHEMRPTEDVEELLSSKWYRVVSVVLDAIVACGTSRVVYPIFRVVRAVFGRIRRTVCRHEGDKLKLWKRS